MAKILEMPKLSPTMEEGVLAEWHKKEGDAIAVDDLLAEVETDKATMEFRAFDKTTLLKILVAPGSQVKLGQPVAIVGEPGEDISALAGQAGATAQAPARAEPHDEGHEGPPSGGRREGPLFGGGREGPLSDQKRGPSRLARARADCVRRPGGADDSASRDRGSRRPAQAAGRERARARVVPGRELVGRPAKAPTEGASWRPLTYGRSPARRESTSRERKGAGRGGRFVPADLDAMTTQGSESLARCAHLAGRADPRRAGGAPSDADATHDRAPARGVEGHRPPLLSHHRRRRCGAREAPYPDQRRDVLARTAGPTAIRAPRRCRSTISSSRRARSRSCACPSATRASRRMRS